MKLSMSERSSWLHWQPIRFSPWLMTTVIVVWIFYMVLFVAPYWQASGGDFNRAFVAAMQARQAGPRAIEIELTFAFQAGLIWFTYFSKSNSVKDHDKFAVFLMLCGAAVGGVILLVRWFIRS